MAEINLKKIATKIEEIGKESLPFHEQNELRSVLWILREPYLKRLYVVATALEDNAEFLGEEDRSRFEFYAKVLRLVYEDL